jgi:hypothetical protein
MFRTIPAACVTLCLAALHADAVGQEAVANDYGYKLADRTSDASYFISGIRRGAEPESVEAWVWTVTPSPAGVDGEQYDAKAQWSVLRCSGGSIEPIRTELYLQGQFLKSIELPPRTPAEVKPGTAAAQVWGLACNSAFRFQAKSVGSLGEAYHIAQGG